MRKFLLKILAALALLLLGLSCGSNSQSGQPEYTLPDVPDEPIWQAQDVETLQLTIARETRHRIPHIREWYPPFYEVNPVFIEKEDDSYVLYGVHQWEPDFVDSIEDVDKDYGANRWVIGEDEIETNLFTGIEGEYPYVLGIDYPDNPGPEYCIIFTVRSDDAARRSIPEGRGLSLYQMDGSRIATVDVNAVNCDIINYLPIDYPGNEIFIVEVYDEDRKYQVYSFTEGGSMYTDSRAAANYGLHWLSDTKEWFYCEERSVDDIERLDIIAEAQDGSVVRFEPWTWPEYSFGEGDHEIQDVIDVPPIFIDGHRHLMVYTAAETSERKIDRWWLVRYDTGESASPVWCRDEPYMPTANMRLFLIGEDERPFLVRYGEVSERLRIIDLVSGECVINERIANARFSSTGNRATLAYYVGENRRIPVVFIFDYEGGELIQIDLEIEE